MIRIINNKSELEAIISQQELCLYLHEHLDKFTDAPSAISKSIDYAFSGESGKGGYLLLALEENELIGAVVINKTGMEEFIPEYLLVYIAVHKDWRGKGIGSKLIKHVFDTCKGAIALHVEYDNPAKRLYERLGFKSKYAEMRWLKDD
ncbi:MAG: GNAT family N-acetyltransferase [Candidatus Cloacimonetes bacterium HGW-Cloacimonetes-3]|jgi:GNAT superfamily N-acetyltransferase|nr:MAG: GNAT family N-acetyltransferase [Candidatus Cloacimonetes bacterium HGW-Cloacimonetes-3]